MLPTCAARAETVIVADAVTLAVAVAVAGAGGGGSKMSVYALKVAASLLLLPLLELVLLKPGYGASIDII